MSAVLLVVKQSVFADDVCDRYANGKATAIVVDVGHFNTSVTAVWEGMVLKKSKSFDHYHLLPRQSTIFSKYRRHGQPTVDENRNLDSVL